MQVNLYSDGYFQRSTTTNSDGSYTVTATKDSYYPYEGFKLRTSSSGDYVDELYRDQPCVYSCDVDAGETVHTPAAGTVSGIDFDLVAAARIQGMVTDPEGQGLDRARIELWDAQGDYLHRIFSAADGSFAFEKLPAGTYYVSAELAYYIGQIYNGLDCPSDPTICGVTNGAAIAVSSGQTVTGIDMQLSSMGAISGTVIEQDGLPIAGAEVEIQNPDGYWIGRAYTDSQGTYLQRGLAAGEYVVKASRYGFLSQYYDGIECELLGGCDLASATRVAVQVHTETSGIDFQLRNIGRISGTIRDTEDNPIAGVRVKLRVAPNTIMSSTYTDTLGQYSFQGLGPRSYFLEAGGNGYLYEIYPDGQCLGPNGICDLEDGVDIELTLGAHRAGIDLQLQEGGRLSGRVTNASGNPLYRWYVYAFDPDLPDFYVAGDVTDANGDYELNQLPAKPVTLLALKCIGCDSRYINEVYPNVHCPPNGSCPISDGTPVHPQVGTTLGRFDFQLETWTTFSGTVLDTETGGNAYGAVVRLWDEDGNQVDATTNLNNSYTLRGAAGMYTITAASDSYYGELFDGVTCPFNGTAPGCDVTTGTVFTVSTDEQITAIDFVLAPRGVLTGRLVSAVDGSGVASRRIEAWDSQPNPFNPTSAYTDADGYFRFTGLEGTYTVSSDPSLSTAIPTLYDGILCPLGVSAYYSQQCDPAKGKQIMTAPHLATPNIQLVEYPAQVGLYGYVKDAGTGAALENVQIDIWNAQDSTLVATATTNANGHYYQALDTSTYLVSSRNSLGYAEQVYVGVDCPNGSAFAGQCDPDQGYSLQLTGDTPIRADFALAPRVLQMLKSDDFESGTLGGWTVVP